nr:dbl [Hymenolepis microstoma]
MEIESFQQCACDLGLEIQSFVVDISKVEALARLSQDFTTFELVRDRVESLQRRRRQLQRRLSSCESRGVDLRKRLRELHESNSSEEEDVEAKKRNANKEISSLDLPKDRSSQILVVEQYIIQLSETRSKLRKFWNRYARGLRNLQKLEDFEVHFKKLQPLLGVWQSLVESVSDYLPGHSGAPILLQGSSTSFSGTSDTSDEADSAVVMEDNSAGNNLSNGPEDPMEGLLTIQSRVKEAQASGVLLLDEIVELIARGESIRDEANVIANSVISVDGDFGATSEAEKRISCESLSSLLARMTFESPQYDPLADGVAGSDELNDFYYADEDESSLTTESDELSLDLPIEPNTSAPPLICLLPEYAEARIDILRKIEFLARTGLGKAANQLDRLVQLYKEINESRQWISKGSNLNAPLTPERITEMDPAFCEETIKQLNAFLESREANLVLKGNPGQFRKQFSDLLNSEMKVELSQMLRSVEEMENSLKMTIANLRQQISRNTFPIKGVPPAYHQNHHNQPQTQQNSSLLSKARQTTTNGLEEFKEIPENPQTILQTSSSPESKITPGERKLTNEKLYRRALHELITTEVNYIKFLEAVTETFSPVLCDSNLPRLPSFIRDNRALLVVNLPEQLVFHKNHFYPQLLACDGDPFLIQKWADSSWGNLVDLYTTYCLNYERATQYAIAFEKDRLHSQWIAAYNRHLSALETEKLLLHSDDHEEKKEDEKRMDIDLRKVASLNRANSCITFDNNQTPDRLAQYSNGNVTAAAEEDEENLPPASRKSSQGSAPLLKSASLSRPLLSYSSRLLEPAQRFQRYHLLIERLRNYAPEGPQKDALSKAHQSMLDMCNTVNALMRIRGLTDRPSRLGKVLLQDNFTIWCGETKNGKHQRYVFLFENAFLLTKLRQTNTSLVSTVLASFGGGSGGGSNSYQPSTIVVPETISLPSASSVVSSQDPSSTSTSGVTLNKPALDRLPACLPVIPADTLSQHPTYEIKMELKLTEVGLTPTIREDRRRFGVWTASRAQTYYFQSNNQQVQSQWVRAINGLLSAQLNRLRDNAQKQRKMVIHPLKSQSSEETQNQILLADSREVDEFEEQLNKEGDVTSHPVLKPKSQHWLNRNDQPPIESQSVDDNDRTLRQNPYHLSENRNISTSIEDSSNNTSLDLSSGPTSPQALSSTTTEVFVDLFRPSIEKLDEVVASYLTNQSSLKALLEEISRNIAESSNFIAPPVDLHQHIQKINTANTRLQVVESNLLRIQARIQALQSKIISS